MSSWQKLLVMAAIVCAVALLGPAAALANGPSAGDQQYVDPLGGSSHHSHSSGSGTTTTGSGTSSITPTATTPTVTVTPYATSSSTGATSSGDPSSTTLPYTGFDELAVVGLGAGLFATGWLMRRITRRA